jgi:hypothetical protein
MVNDNDLIKLLQGKRGFFPIFMEDKKKPKVIDVDAKTGMVNFSLFLSEEAAIKYAAKEGKPLDSLATEDH